MGKRRTKKQKLKAKRKFSVYFENEAETSSFEPVVKGQFKKSKKGSDSKLTEPKNAVPTAKVRGVKSIRRDIVKSIILASLILGTELVIYLARTR